MVVRNHERPLFAAVEKRLGFRDRRTGGDMVAAFFEMADERLQHGRVVIDDEQGGPRTNVGTSRDHGMVGQRIAKRAGTHRQIGWLLSERTTLRGKARNRALLDIVTAATS